MFSISSFIQVVSGRKDLLRTMKWSLFRDIWSSVWEERVWELNCLMTLTEWSVKVDLHVHVCIQLVKKRSELLIKLVFCTESDADRELWERTNWIRDLYMYVHVPSNEIVSFLYIDWQLHCLKLLFHFYEMSCNICMLFCSNAPQNSRSLQGIL